MNDLFIDENKELIESILSKLHHQLSKAEQLHKDLDTEVHEVINNAHKQQLREMMDDIEADKGE